MKNPLEDLTGRQLGPYQLVAPLGKGGMGVVYKAYDTQLARYVAVKVLPPRYVMEPTFVGRFWQEAKAAANLEHPHILPVYAYGEHEGYHYIAMQLVREGSLAGLLQGRPLAPEQMREIVTQVGGALDFAHSREVVHRDVKPDNILISRRSGCLLADFGIAKLLESTAHLTQTGASVGTPTYMSPEQIQGEADVDGRSDIYSLGVVLYQMATGRPPFQGNSIQAIQMQHLYQPPPPPHDLNPELSTALVEVMLKALAKKPEERYAAAYDMVSAMQAAIPRGRASEEGAGAAILGPISPAAGGADQDAETGRPIATEELGAILDATSAPPAPEERRHDVTQPLLRIGPAAHPSEPSPPPPGATQALPRPPRARLGQIPVAAWAAVLVVVVLAVVGVLALDRRERFLAGGPALPTASPGAGETPTVAVALPPTRTSTPLPSATPTPPPELTSTSTPPSPTRTATPTSPPSATPTATPQPTPTHTPTAAQPAAADLGGRLMVPLMYGNEPKVYIVSSSGELQAVVGAARQPDYSPDGSRVVVNGEGGEWDKLRILDPIGGAPFEVGDPALAGHSYPSWSPDGNRLIYEDGTVDPVGWRIFIRDLSTNGPGSGAGTLLKAGVGQGELVGRQPLWTNRDRLIFRACNTWQAGQESECGLWVMQGNGGTPERLTANPNHIPTDVRGETLVYSSAEKGDWSVYALDLASGAVRQLTGEGADEGLATISPDGRSVAFLSNREGRLAVWTVSIQGGTARKLFDLPADWGSLRPDGWSEEKLSWGSG